MPRPTKRLYWSVNSCLKHLQEGRVSIERRADLLKRAEPRICAFDIETTKLPLQFPNAEYDQVSFVCPTRMHVSHCSSYNHE